MITKEAQKIWQSKSGGNLMEMMLGEKKLTKEDLLTLKRLKALNSQDKPQKK